MKISVMGVGDMGSALATALSKRSKHEVLLRGSKIGSSNCLQLCKELGLKEASQSDLHSSDMIFVVVPGTSLNAVAKELEGFSGTIVSVIGFEDYLKDGSTSFVSAAEQMAELVPTAKVVHGFTCVSSSIVRDPSPNGKTSVVICGDNENTCLQLIKLATEMGFHAVRGGGLVNARYAEAAGHLWAALAFDGNYGWRVHFEVHLD